MKQLQVRNPAARGCIRDVALDEQVCNVSEEAVRFFAPTSHYYFWDPWDCLLLSAGSTETWDEEAALFGSANMCIVTLGSVLKRVMISSSGLLPVLSGFTVVAALAISVHNSLSALINCWRVIRP